LTEKSFNPGDFFMPAEWEPLEGAWLQWYQDRVDTGYEQTLERIWLDMVEALHDHEMFHVVVGSERQHEHVTGQLQYNKLDLENVDFHIIHTNDVEAHDNSHILVVNNLIDTAATDWQFNGWGKRFPHELDNKVPAAVGENLGSLSHWALYRCPDLLDIYNDRLA
jgi:agmatine deiminase